MHAGSALVVNLNPVHANISLAGIRILAVAQAVPDELPNIELVVENAGPAAGIAVDRRRAPCAAERTGDAIGVERAGSGSTMISRSASRARMLARCVRG